MAENILSLYPFSISADGRNLVHEAHSGVGEPRTLALMSNHAYGLGTAVAPSDDQDEVDEMVGRVSDLQELTGKDVGKRSLLDTTDEGNKHSHPITFLRQTKSKGAPHVVLRLLKRAPGGEDFLLGRIVRSGSMGELHGGHLGRPGYPNSAATCVLNPLSCFR